MRMSRWPEAMRPPTVDEKSPRIGYISRVSPIDRLAILSHAAIVIDAEIEADARQPGLKIRTPVEAVERLEDLQEDVLRQVFRLVLLADQLVRDVEHFPPVLTNDCVPG